MSDNPFGFRLPDDADDADDSAESNDANSGAAGNNPTPKPSDSPESSDPLAGLMSALGGPGGFNPASMGAALEQLGRLMSWSGGPVNWDLARQAARQSVAAAGADPSVSGADRRDIDEAVRLVDLWLDEATVYPIATTSVRAWSRAEWIENTVPGWQPLVEPVAERVAGAMGSAIPEELATMAGPMMGMMTQIGVSMWGAQAGQGLGALATEVHGVTDIGIPLVQPGNVVLLPHNIRVFGEGLGIANRDVLVYLALREVARHRLHVHAPWLTKHVTDLVTAYAQGITIDVSRIESAMRDLDPSQPEAISSALESGLFEPELTPAQQATLERLETVLALIEGWVADVVGQAAGPRLGTADALAETIRRARAAGGPAEQTFSTLVGLQLRPRRLREATTLFAALREAGGIEARDAVWDHVDLLPSSANLDDPDAYVSMVAGLGSEVTDDLLAELLDSAAGEQANEGDEGDNQQQAPGQGDADDSTNS